LCDVNVYSLQLYLLVFKSFSTVVDSFSELSILDRTRLLERNGRLLITYLLAR
jgi:hypothetical protein